MFYGRIVQCFLSEREGGDFYILGATKVKDHPPMHTVFTIGMQPWRLIILEWCLFRTEPAYTKVKKRES